MDRCAVVRVTLPPRFTTTPCKACGELFVLAPVGGKVLQLDASAPVYVAHSDGDGGTTWLRETAALVDHAATCRARGESSRDRARVQP